MSAGTGQRKLAAALADVGVSPGWVLDQSTGITPLLPGVECRGFARAFDWQPEAPPTPARRVKKK